MGLVTVAELALMLALQHAWQYCREYDLSLSRRRSTFSQRATD